VNDREAPPVTAPEAIVVGQRLDDRALRILTDGQRHAAPAIRWAIHRNPFMAQFRAKELARENPQIYGDLPKLLTEAMRDEKVSPDAPRAEGSRRA
jgi:hypothetical protein